MSCTYNHVFNILNEDMTNLSELDKNKYVYLLKLINTVTRSASNLSALHDKTLGYSSGKQHILCFLGQNFYEGNVYSKLVLFFLILFNFFIAIRY